jgi:hypothetical protein
MELIMPIKLDPGEGIRSVVLNPSKPGTGYKLIYNRKEVIGNFIFRLDRIRKNLMVSHAFDPLRLIFMAELNKIRSVSLKRTYRDIKSGHFSSMGLDEFLEGVHFRFEFIDGRNSVHLPLFEKSRDKTYHLDRLEEKAKTWYRLLSGLLKHRGKTSFVKTGSPAFA